MGHIEVQTLSPRSAYDDEEPLTHEMHERCRYVAEELRLIGDSLETSYTERRSINRFARVAIGFTLLAISSNIVLRQIIAGFLARQ